jgi:hypothetical protein
MFGRGWEGSREVECVALFKEGKMGVEAMGVVIATQIWSY